VLLQQGPAFKALINLFTNIDKCLFVINFNLFIYFIHSIIPCFSKNLVVICYTVTCCRPDLFVFVKTFSDNLVLCHVVAVLNHNNC